MSLKGDSECLYFFLLLFFLLLDLLLIISYNYNCLKSTMESLVRNTLIIHHGARPLLELLHLLFLFYNYYNCSFNDY